jgi:hypothetical protein
VEKTRPKRKAGTGSTHLSTARLLDKRKVTNHTP